MPQSAPTPTLAEKAIITGHIATFLDPVAGNALAYDVRERLELGDQDAFFIPAVKFIIDTTLAVCNEQIRRGDMPQEVEARALRASNIGRNLTIGGINSRLFVDAYRANPHLKPWLDDDATFHLSDRRYMESLAPTTFTDAGRSGGGGHRLLGEVGLAANAAETVANSSGLLITAGIGRKHMKRLAYQLGVPYVHRKYLELAGDEDHPELELSAQCLAYLKPFLDTRRGCPARKIRSPDNARETVMRQGFRTIIAFLLSEGATTSKRS